MAAGSGSCERSVRAPQPGLSVSGALKVARAAGRGVKNRSRRDRKDIALRFSFFGAITGESAGDSIARASISKCALPGLTTIIAQLFYLCQIFMGFTSPKNLFHR